MAVASSQFCQISKCRSSHVHEVSSTVSVTSGPHTVSPQKTERAGYFWTDLARINMIQCDNTLHKLEQQLNTRLIRKSKRSFFCAFLACVERQTRKLVYVRVSSLHHSRPIKPTLGSVRSGISCKVAHSMEIWLELLSTRLPSDFKVRAGSTLQAAANQRLFFL